MYFQIENILKNTFHHNTNHKLKLIFLSNSFDMLISKIKKTEKIILMYF
jgi:hypothetical protein